MISFKQYLREAKEGKNLHLTHIEDSIFDGVNATVGAFEFLDELGNMLQSNAAGKYGITVKWDGAPAVFAGINPENGKFFVGTKSVFNVSPKINYTNKDIDNNHGHAPVLAYKLKQALKYFPALGIKGVVQGDLLYTKDDLKAMNIDGETNVTFKPNTILYAVPKSSKLYKKITQSDIGVVWHTRYSGKTMQSMKASFGYNASSLRNTKNVWSTDATFKDDSGVVTFTKEEHEQYRKSLSYAVGLFNSSKSSIAKITSDSELVALLNIYVNSLIRTGSYSPSSVSFLRYIAEREEKEIAKLKSDTAKAKKQEKYQLIKSSIKSNASSFDKIFQLHSALIQCKEILIAKLKKARSLGHYLMTPKGLKVTDPEGFVAIDNSGGTAYKLVDRLEFSRANFNLAKDWS